MWFSLLQLSLQRINQLWQLMGLGGQFAPGKTNHTTLGVKSQFGKIALVCMRPPPQYHQLLQGVVFFKPSRWDWFVDYL